MMLRAEDRLVNQIILALNKLWSNRDIISEIIQVRAAED